MRSDDIKPLELLEVKNVHTFYFYYDLLIQHFVVCNDTILSYATMIISKVEDTHFFVLSQVRVLVAFFVC